MHLLTCFFHRATEDFSYFTLLRPASEKEPTATSLFGISCTRQLDASQLLNRPADVTRSTVQKAVVVIADSPQYFGVLRERLSVVTSAWFAQREFTDTEILRRFQESLAEEKTRGSLSEEEDRDQYLGMSLRELVREFRWQTLVLLKCCLLQPKVCWRCPCYGQRLTPADALLWHALRAPLHDAVLSYIFNTRASPKPPGLGRSRLG